MSEKQFEPCTLEEATHVEMGGKVHELGIGDGSESKHPNVIKQVIQYNRYCIEVYMESGGWQRIQTYAFPILGIKCLREKKQEPIEFEGEVVIGTFHGADVTMLLAPTGIGTKFKCIEILEDEE